ncbi:hypothetical protein ACIGMX_32770 [Streptomyces aquilus]|uniref:hypothetical protein n=1 Tax=Streptomyces aquilus TaxID=2548456 RepID=UPI0037CF81A3
MTSRATGRGVLDGDQVVGEDGELTVGFALNEEHPNATADEHGVAVGRGNISVVRTGRLVCVARLRLAPPLLGAADDPLGRISPCGLSRRR